MQSFAERNRKYVGILFERGEIFWDDVAGQNFGAEANED